MQPYCKTKRMKHTGTKFLLFICFVSAMGGFLFGYDWVVIGGAKIFYEPFFGIDSSAALRGWAMSSALLGCLIGAVFSGTWSDKYGRKKLLVLAAVLFLLSAIGTGAVDSFFWFIFYRIVGGLGIGIASNISPIYIAEVSPAEIRGRLVSLNQLTIVLGILSAQLINWAIGESYETDCLTAASSGVHWAWRWMFWAEAVPAALFLILSFIIPESPKWLAAKIRCERYDFSVLTQPHVRRVLIIGVVLAMFQQWCGINVIFNYAHEIFSAAGYEVSSILMNIVITGVTNVIFTLVAIYTVDRWGRRSLMLFGAAGLTVIYLVMGFCYYIHLNGWIMLLLVVMAIACYAMSLAPVVWVVLSEIFPQQIRGTAMAISTFFLWTACFILTYTFPVLNEWLQASGIFWVYGLICLGGFLFIWYKLPETKGQSLEQIEENMKLKNELI